MSVRNQAMTRAVQDMLFRIKAGCFTQGYHASDTEAMGLLLSHFFDYDGAEILRAAEHALEDANFHAECARVGEIRAGLEEPAEPAERVYAAPSHSQRGLNHRVTLSPDSNTCTCGDHVYRHRACKHITAALAGRLTRVR